MFLLALLFLIGSNQASAKPSHRTRSAPRIKTSAAETGSHCIDYENFVYTGYTQAISYDNSSRRFGAVDCLLGDIVLAGTYINLGNRIVCH